tara:strand:- start:3797 stop:4081 length:285 start_codon:yes stop_codon:yes gene_type:complete
MSTFGILTNLGGGIGSGNFTVIEAAFASDFTGATFPGFTGATLPGFTGATFPGFTARAGFVVMLLTEVLAGWCSQADTLSKTINSNRDVFTRIV